ncbi:Gfo/Idh/MocA family protein [Sphingobacterium multivorum]|uniref:Gfo/Idh/MocA family oxidoreductase n=1 Tax=Sphingobacterium paramultivorum TaxID=2886510 RepID=A0A7G5E036_9SPHI|nr:MULTISPECIES: Gfo/Idh/MocA family oxidoreductase [Sphingobacterium]MCS4164516.1 putative dehydrogenase [Sphingobacterium sp. BIGb0116]QMV67361.1 Gfo/Idh/MocA family oxidoreductase [Sphingobacterium paramultivorum]WSO16218.1 Gfo/Idh/MocA family oxidoreductase [Sphingobacterium paramultivorum]
MRNTKLKMGMVGGGKNAFIGAVHRMAAGIDGQIELCCGALSADPLVARESAALLGLPKERSYGSYQEMIVEESKRSADDRMNFVSIVTPNFAHFEPAMMALEHGFHVVLEKPMTLTTEQAELLQQKVAETGLILCVTYTYSAYPMVKQARHLVKEGQLGSIRKIMVEYPQGWLSKMIENGLSLAFWRTDPEKSGKSGCMGDIGTHAAHLAEYISGLKITKMCADLQTFVTGRKLEDDGNILLGFENGATGVLSASQVAAGEENALKIRVYGELGGLEWNQQDANTLIFKQLDAPTQLFRAGQQYLSPIAKHNIRLPAGHPEGYIEAFANIYRNFAATLLASMQGIDPREEDTDFPTVADGLRGMKFLETVIASGKSAQKWTNFIR